MFPAKVLGNSPPGNELKNGTTETEKGAWETKLLFQCV